MFGLSWLLFSFRGEIKRASFFWGLVLRWIIISVITWITMKLTVDITSTPLPENGSIHYSAHIQYYFLFYTIKFLSFWMFAVLLIKIYSHIGVRWYFTLLFIIISLYFDFLIEINPILMSLKNIMLQIITLNFKGALYFLITMPVVYFKAISDSILDIIGFILFIFIPLTIKEIERLKYR
jgi:uncharacterized membrane protein YhaH (DUF805 family)